MGYRAGIEFETHLGMMERLREWGFPPAAICGFARG